MKLINILPATMLCAALLNTNQASAQTWNVTGNAGTATTNYLGTSDAKDLKIKTNNQTRMFVKSSGQVGIGTSAPAAFLHIQKSVLTDVLVKSTGASAQLTIDRAASNSDAAILYATNGVAQWKTALSNPLVGNPEFRIYNIANSTVAFSIHGNTNNVGIGTTVAAATLEVQRNNSASVLVKSIVGGAQLTLDRGANGFDAVTSYTQAGVPQWTTGLTLNAIGTPDYVVRNAVTSTDAMVITGNNNFVTFSSGLLMLGTTNTSSVRKNGDDLKLLAHAPTNFPGAVAGNIILASPGTFFKSGNVAIGTDDASRAKFIVQGNVGKTNAIFGQGSKGIALVQDWPGIGFNSYVATNTWKSLGAGYGAQISLDPASGVMYIGASNNATAADEAVAGTSALIINASGNVGIGTNANTYKLDVCGTMRANEVRVATNWCDYVFAEDYKLPALSDVESFIKENKHLPEVTPGAIIESEGLEIGKTSAQMIKKIEELTLYVIDLQKQVNELKKSDK